MKIKVNFDLINAIMNVNEDFNAFKVIRNNKKKWATIYLPFYLIVDIALLSKVASIPLCLLIQFGYLTAGEVYYEHIYNRDIYKEESIDNLRKLVGLLNNIYLETSYDLLLQSELYDKKYKIELNDNFPNLKEEKFILVPTYDYNGNTKKTSILQEHFIGTDDYILSLGSPKKSLSKVLSYT